MVVGPEYGAIIVAALGISKGQRDAIRDGLIEMVDRGERELHAGEVDTRHSHRS
jgi:hypothetical protein